MITLIILISTAIVLSVTGSSWVEIAVAVPLFFVFAYGSTFAQSGIERRTGRKFDPKSESDALTYYGITLGIVLPSIYFFPDLHPLVFVSILLLSSTLGIVASIARCGVQSPHGDAS